ncbi:response regulator transcription factor [Dethiosulfovibrio salsuginis]|uniref:response regulator transcription factor n=1 Tax=Dethiosulfovibrio salsuginis TaxID=561720 RepID=UPI001F3998EF|nr:response regulator transcription factor [Dethiosulfovibrio salsuginis]
MTSIKVMVVDDHEIFRTALVNIIGLEEDMEVVGEAGDGLEALALLETVAPDIALVDVTMPRMGGAELVRQMESRGIGLPVVALTAMEDERSVLELSRAGVRGYILKTSGFDDLVKAIRSVFHGGDYVDPKVASKLLSGFSKHRDKGDVFDRLSDRELEVLFWLSQGLNGQDIAERLFLSDKTVKNHISHILSKLEVSDRTQAVSLAWRSGLAAKSPEEFRR